MNNILSLRDVDISSLSELCDIDVDCNLPVSERIRNFASCTKSLYLYKVRDRIVKVVFDIGATKKLEDGILNALNKIIASDS